MRDFDINQPAPEKEEDEEIPEGDNDEEGENKNPRRKRLRLSEEQTKLLEQSFRMNQLNISQVRVLVFLYQLNELMALKNAGVTITEVNLICFR